MPEKTLDDLNQGEEQTPAGTGQPENNASASEDVDDTSEIDAIDSEIDTVLNTEDDDDADEGGDDGDDDEKDAVTLRKELEKKERNLKNYREGLLATKQKLAALKRARGKPETSQPVSEAPTKNDPNAPITKRDLQKQNADKAIKDITEFGRLPDGSVDKKIAQDINENWSQVVRYYRSTRGKDSPESIAEDILDAHTLFRRHTPLADDDEDGEAASTLASENGKPSGGSQEGKPKERKGGLLPKRQTAKDWY